VGPELYPHFISTLRIVLSVVAVLAVLGMGVSLGATARTPADLGKALLEGVGGVFNALFQALGIVVAFTALETGKQLYKLTLRGRLPALES